MIAARAVAHWLGSARAWALLLAPSGVAFGCVGQIGYVEGEAALVEEATPGAGAGGSGAGTAGASSGSGAGAIGAGAFEAGAPSSAPDAGTPASADALPEESEPPPPVTFCDAPTLVLQASCGNGSCHSNPGASIGDFAVSAERAEAYVDRLSVRNATCGRIIDSRNYAQSLLLTKIIGGFPSPECGATMPVGSFVITREQIDCLASWLQQFQR